MNKKHIAVVMGGYSSEFEISLKSGNVVCEFINAEKFLKNLGSPYNIILSDIDGTLAIEWGAYGVPETFLIHNNKIIRKIIGPITKDLLIEIQDLTK